MAPKFRVIDTGLREGRANIAFDQAMIEAHQAGDVPDTIRFLHFPKTALIGRHQALSEEVQLDYCRDNDVGVVRRITGGGAIYFDEGQIGWELAFHRQSLSISTLPELTKAICEAAAAGLSRLGINAKYRPRNDIEVDGRKLCGTGGFFDGDTLFYQGTLLIEMNPADMVAALKIPAQKLAKRDLASAEQRVVTLHELLDGNVPSKDEIKEHMLVGFAEHLGIETEWGEATAREEELAKELYEEEIGTDDFVTEIDNPGAGDNVKEASHTGPGGTVKAFLRLEGPHNDRIREVLVTGDFFVTPPRTILDLEAHLRGTLVSDLEASVQEFFEKADIGLLTIQPADFQQVILDAAQS
jgi:lipoate-protein ligase A